MLRFLFTRVSVFAQFVVGHILPMVDASLVARRCLFCTALSFGSSCDRRASSMIVDRVGVD